MSRIPDCRTDDAYNQKYLNAHDSAEIRGYDWCTEEVVDNFFDNLEVYMGDDDYLHHILKEELPQHRQEIEDVEWTFGNRGSEKREIKTYGDLLRSYLENWIEMHRDELITSMLENMSEDEYNKIKEEVDKRENQR